MKTENMPDGWGKEAEQIAADYLAAQGYVIRERNWSPKNSHLEVDIISQHEDTIIFIEVKARAAGGIDPADAVDDKKIRCLVRAANIYLHMQPYDFFWRFDIITVTGETGNYEIDHIPDAFLPPLTTR